MYASFTGRQPFFHPSPARLNTRMCRRANPAFAFCTPMTIWCKPKDGIIANHSQVSGCKSDQNLASISAPQPSKSTSISLELLTFIYIRPSREHHGFKNELPTWISRIWDRSNFLAAMCKFVVLVRQIRSAKANHVQWILYSIGVVIYNLTLHPLAKFPGPFIRRAFDFPLYWEIYTGELTMDMQALHDKYGDTVRTSPGSLSYNNPEAWQGDSSTHSNHRIF